MLGLPHQLALLVEVLLTTQQLHVLVEDACHVLKFEEFRAVEAPESQLGSGFSVSVPGITSEVPKHVITTIYYQRKFRRQTPSYRK